MRKNTIVFAFFLFLTACAHSHLDRVPVSYRNYQIPLVQFADKNPPAKLQILVTRSFLYSSHSALRLLYKGRVLMWDPSGSYGDMAQHGDWFSDNPLPDNFKKINDLILQGAPALPFYFRFAQYTQDNEMEVFEWRLPDEVAAYYQDLLIKGATEAENEYGFHTHHPFYLCSSYLTRTLQQHINRSFQLRETYFFPDSLAHELFEHHPDRIYFFAKHRPVTVFQKP